MANVSTSSQRDPEKARRKKSSIHLDMTPMVDLGFLLITFFMLTTTITKPSVMEVVKQRDEATAPHKAISEKNLLTLVLGRNNQIFWFVGQTSPTVHKSNFSAEGIRKVLLKKKKEIKKLHVFIKATDESRYQNLVDVLDELIITEIENYSIMDMTPADGKRIAPFRGRSNGV